MPSLMRQINVISRCGGQYRTSRLEQVGLAGYQGSYLLCVCKNPGISQDQVAQRTYVNKSTAARALSALYAIHQVKPQGNVGKDNPNNPQEEINFHRE